MKLLVILLLVLLMVALLGSRPSSGASAGQPGRSNWLVSWTILALRITRGSLVLVTLLAAAMAFRLLLVVGVSAHANIHSPGAWQSVLTAVVLLAGIVALFWFLFWALRRLRLRVNQLHRERHNTAALLLAGRWSL